MYKPLPLDWVNWNPAQVSYADYAKIVKSDPPLTAEEKTNDAISALYEYSFWKEEIPTRFLELSKTTKPEEFRKSEQLEDRAKTIKSHELRRMVLEQAGKILSDIIGCDGPVL